MEADGLEEIEAGGWGDAGDYYVSGKTLSPVTTPSIAKYDGTPNPMKVWSISALGSPMTAQIDEIADATAPTGVPGTPSDEGATTTSTDITFTWTKGTLADPETGIAGYDLQVGTTAGGSDLFDGSLGNVPGRTVANAQDGSTYYARVRGANGTGLKSSWSSSSDGITVNLPTLSCAALDNCSLVFKTGGAASWFEQSTVSYYGGSAAQSADIGDNQASFMQTTVVGPGSFSFWWRVSSESGYDYLRVYVDGVASGSGISGTTSWAQRTLTIAAGSHVVKWVYAKDEMVSSGSDAAWVDRVAWVSSGSSLSANDVTVSEGNAGTKSASFTVTLSPAAASTVTVNYATANGTATTADSDYASATGTLTFSAGTTTQPVNVTVNGDTKNEANETFSVNLSTPSNATIADSQGVGTITNDDPLPALSINDVSVSEGNAGGTTASFTVTLSAASGQTVTVAYATANGTATTADSDYASAAGTLTFSAGTTTQTVNVTVNGDTKNETNEALYVNLSGPTNATIGDAQGLGTITNDDPLPSLSISDVTVSEGNAGAATASFTVTLSAASGQIVTASYSTADGTATTADGDYVAITSGTLTFGAGATSGPLSVTVNGDLRNEANEVFYMNLSAPSNATIADNQGVGTITNDDPPPSLSVNDVSVSEGNAGTKSASFTATLSAASSVTVTVNYATANGTATTADSDYASATGTLTFSAGTTTQPVNVTVNGDTKNEANETFSVNLSTPSNATIADSQGVGTITNDDAVARALDQRRERQ